MKERSLGTMQVEAQVTRTAVDTEIAKGTLMTVGGVSLLVGIWALACFVGGAINHGPVALLRGWFQAVSGM